jgi:hypothetical protein
MLKFNIINIIKTSFMLQVFENYIYFNMLRQMLSFSEQVTPKTFNTKAETCSFLNSSARRFML